MHNTKFDYLTLKFKNEFEFIFEISSATRERLEEEISRENNDLKFIFDKKIEDSSRKVSDHGLALSP